MVGVLGDKSQLEFIGLYGNSPNYSINTDTVILIRVCSTRPINMVNI